MFQHTHEVQFFTHSKSNTWQTGEVGGNQEKVLILSWSYLRVPINPADRLQVVMDKFWYVSHQENTHTNGETAYVIIPSNTPTEGGSLHASRGVTSVNLVIKPQNSEIPLCLSEDDIWFLSDSKPGSGPW